MFSKAVVKMHHQTHLHSTLKACIWKAATFKTHAFWSKCVLPYALHILLSYSHQIFHLISLVQTVFGYQVNDFLFLAVALLNPDL
ncbi:hypothetical protein GDO81_005502 [Engystomops pustulosus]|uniref:Uncharacterized protein n=1 Tax=Engystomops pustulosus TaxID=76066 RepID=A0AAV7CQ66_ENGPU|nr:hypothetical protein GDO81_005502 [Engystomops pustulosus]